MVTLLEKTSIGKFACPTLPLKGAAAVLDFSVDVSDRMLNIADRLTQ
ncbi:MAG: hypothetical protein ACI8R4_001023 [Paracoccaceae bacterium]